MRVRHGLIVLLLTLVGLAATGTAVNAGQSVETEEGIAYALPDGWSVKSYSKRDGSATLVHGASGATMLVQRYGLTGKRDPYSNKVPLPEGRTLEWQYQTILVSPLFLGRVTLAEAHIEMSATAKDPKGRVPEQIGLAAMRQIAQTARVTGPRRCTGSDCKDGVVKETK
jgi:hypothetical protein